MSKRRLYVTDWAPNGTNDLLVVDENGVAIAGLEETTFGLSININDGVLFEGQVIAADLTDLNGCTFLRRVTLDHVSRCLATRPGLNLEDASNRVLAFLNANGVI